MKILPTTMMFFLIPFSTVLADDTPKKGKVNQTRTAVLTQADTNVRVSTLWTSKSNPDTQSSSAKAPLSSGMEGSTEVPLPDDFVDVKPPTDKTKKTDPKASSLSRSARQKQRTEKRNPNRPLIEDKMSARPVGPIAESNDSETERPIQQVAMPNKRLTIYSDSSLAYSNLY